MIVVLNALNQPSNYCFPFLACSFLIIGKPDCWEGLKTCYFAQDISPIGINISSKGVFAHFKPMDKRITWRYLQQNDIMKHINSLLVIGDLTQTLMLRLMLQRRVRKHRRMLPRNLSCPPPVINFEWPSVRISFS